MRQHQQKLEIRTPGRGLHEITAQVEQVLAESKIRMGLCTVFCCHTSASLLIQENADPTAMRDLLAWLERIAPDGDSNYTHDTEGPDDMPSHLRAAVTRTSESIPVSNGRLVLGAWQGIYLAEHRTRPHRRQIVLHIFGE
ncbi:MAG: secondary thiamine-phosphate synthase enzyme YjbQ [Candidatus Sumerlaeaceae bacterium]